MMKITQTILSDDLDDRQTPIDFSSVETDNELEIISTFIKMMDDARKDYAHSETVSIRIDF